MLITKEGGGQVIFLRDFIPVSVLRKCVLGRRLLGLFGANLLLGPSWRMPRSLMRCVPQLCSQVGSRQEKENKLDYFVRWWNFRAEMEKKVSSIPPV